MIVRQALFEGILHPGREQAFRDYVAEKLVPLWQAFPGVREVRVLHAVDRDEGAPVFAMILSTIYDDRAALARALESPVRYESRELTKGLLEMFEGHIHHHVFELDARSTD